LLGIPYEALDENKIKQGLQGFGFFIVPGAILRNICQPSVKLGGKRSAISSSKEDIS
jgi:hypothetical protein